MSLSLTLACLWVVTAAVIALIPSRRHHWPQAYVLIAFGLPILGFVIHENGILVGLLVFLAGASILRWPLVYLWRWARRIFG
ncbi:DUF2484 family protein [Aliiruegeria sabulilitoris]|uniref:DUF2484 family protein n=1 Tax=Aliiruegeria sabulilitoris TaxID=1510458 RepID=UPI000831C8BD|nr:DUF2484 family protein [Aliiruegeria sabulilitoris]NDR56568.1 DUF2484 family protein [Pseudoruegeria sp. M32A2M]